MHDRTGNADEYGKGACSVSYPRLIGTPHLKTKEKERAGKSLYRVNTRQSCHRQLAEMFFKQESGMI